MKLSRALTALVLVAAISATGAAAAQATTPSLSVSGFEPRGLRSTASLETSLVSGSASSVSAPAPASLTGPMSARRVIVRLKDSAKPRALSSLARSAETSAGTVRQIVPGAYSWKVPAGRSAAAFAAQLQASPAVEYAVPDYERVLTASYVPPAYVEPRDPIYTSTSEGRDYATNSRGKRVLAARYLRAGSWWLRDIHSEAAWSQGYTGSNIVGKYPLRADPTEKTVAVIDSGLYAQHPDNAANIVGGRDFFDHETATELSTDDDVTPVDPSWVRATYSYQRLLTVSHGTCVSGEIGASVNDIGTVGVGYDTRVIVHKVMGRALDGHATIYDSAVIAAIRYSVEHDHAKVINMSLGGYDYSPAIAEEINYAYSQGCVIVAAKGNDGSKRRFYPASNNHVISVGALGRNAKAATIPAYYSNYTKTPLDIMAPGSYIWGLSSPYYSIIAGSAYPPGYFVWDGTSMAAPVVSGAIALLWRAAPALSNAEITSEVLSSAPKGPKSRRYPSGYRKLDMAATYARLKADYPLLTKPAMADQTVAVVQGGMMPISWGVPMARLRGVTYDVSYDSVHMETTTQTGRTVWFNPNSDTLISVTAHSPYNWDDGTATNEAWLHVLPSVPGTSTWIGAHVAGSSATYATPVYGTAVAIDATLKDAAGTNLAGGGVQLQASADGTIFADVASEANLPDGLYRGMAAPVSRTWYRAAFSGSNADGISEAYSEPVVVIPGVYLTKPATKSSISHTKKLSANGKLAPAHASSSRRVKLKIKRWNGHRWADYSAVWTRLTRRNSSYSSYAVTFKLKKGAYRLYAFTAADGLHSATTSGYRSVTVK